MILLAKVSRNLTDRPTVIYPVGLGTKNHSAGEAQQQFSSQSVRQSLTHSVSIIEQLVIESDSHKWTVMARKSVVGAISQLQSSGQPVRT
jgi:hypothetical protein